MEKQITNAGVYPVKDGQWGYRFTIWINGRKIDRKRIQDEDGNPFTSKLAAARARKAAIEREKRLQRENDQKQQRIDAALAAINPIYKTVKDVYTVRCGMIRPVPNRTNLRFNISNPGHFMQKRPSFDTNLEHLQFGTQGAQLALCELCKMKPNFP